MINSRKIEDLHPKVQPLARKLIEVCAAEGIKIQVTATLRDFEYQNSLYAQGRTKPGPIVTNAKGGQSLHNYGVAFDVVPVRDGKAVWGTTGADGALWRRIGVLGASLGLEWGGDWKSLKDLPHFQYTGGLSLANFQAGRTL